MGRYFQGDINGKFAFGIQESDDAKHFGGECLMKDEDTLEFRFNSENHSESVERGLVDCLESLGDHKEIMDSFYYGEDLFTDSQLAAALRISIVKLEGLRKLYFRYELGKMIQEKLDETGRCNFTAEL